MSFRKIHGGSKERLFSIWTGMKSRCLRPTDQAFSRYGGRGIGIYSEWVNDYAKFRAWALANGYSEKLTIDRIDNDGDYNPVNCRWCTMGEQNSNKSNNNYLSLNNDRLTVMQWANKTGIPRSTILNRLQAGWTTQASLTTPSENQSVSYEYEGQTLELNEWARLKSVPKSTLWARINLYGFSFADAITKPIKRR